MPLLLPMNTPLLCGHGGKATPALPNPRISLLGAAAIPQSSPVVIAGCPQAPPAGPPCVAGNWIMGSVRLKSLGQPLVLQNSPSTTQPTPVPMNVIPIYTRAQAT